MCRLQRTVTVKLSMSSTVARFVFHHLPIHGKLGVGDIPEPLKPFFNRVLSYRTDTIRRDLCPRGTVLSVPRCVKWQCPLQHTHTADLRRFVPPNRALASLARDSRAESMLWQDGAVTQKVEAGFLQSAWSDENTRQLVQVAIKGTAKKAWALKCDG